jgi:hypothetical protein
VITGFNTDIDYNGVTYHVQTEDKGLETPLILSLVYNRGTILASKRSPYNDLLLGDFNEKELAERLQRQHKLICAAIRAGRIEDLKKMNGKNGAAKKTETFPVAAVEVPVSVVEVQNVVETAAPPIVETKVFPEPSESSLLKDVFDEPAPIKKPEIDLPLPPPQPEPPKIEFTPEPADAPIEITDADLIFEDTQHSFDQIVMVPDEAVEIITAFSEPLVVPDNELFIELLNEVTFRGGESKTVSIVAGRGLEKTPLSGVALMVKVLGSNFRPLIFHTKTDSNGIATVHLQIPPFSRGRAAVLIKANHENKTAELRRIISTA